MHIRRPRGITVQQLMVVTALGFLGGVYIWQPLIVKWKKDNTDKKDQIPETLSASTETTITSKLMSSIKNIKQFATSTTGIMAIGIFSTLIVSVSYRVFMKPELDKKHRQEAEANADFIFQQELQRNKSNEKHNF
ncbi:hypothetical protein DOY81_012635 [Sarcophaga bullata]|nr:hypothetical protein DOY81_013482 [Sarcophaga bullata]TMW42285.1 hypothetical protein DOY81_012635 [Sarcophaga bullata]